MRRTKGNKWQSLLAVTITSSLARVRQDVFWPTGFGRPKRFRPTARGWWQRRLHLDQDPVGYLYCIGNPKLDWGFKTEPEPGLNGRAIDYPRGKVLGGCSSING